MRTIERQLTRRRDRHRTRIDPRGRKSLDKLVDALAVLLLTTPYADLTATAVSRRAGMSLANFYQYFENLNEAIEYLPLTAHRDDEHLIMVLRFIREEREILERARQR